MGRHSRRKGRAAEGRTAGTPVDPEPPGPGVTELPVTELPVTEMPARGAPRFPDGTPAHGTPQAGGGRPDQGEAGGGWGRFASAGAPYGAQPGASVGYAEPRVPRQRQQSATRNWAEPEVNPAASGAPASGPRQAYLDAFDEVDDVLAPHRATHAAPGTEVDEAAEEPPGEVPGSATEKGTKGRAFAGIAAAAVTTVLAVVVTGQVIAARVGSDAQSQAGGFGERDARDSAPRSEDPPTPSEMPSATPLTYDKQMGMEYPLAADLKGNGKFQTVRGFDQAPGTGQKYRYRVDVEEGLGLDAELFAEAVQKTLNDDRSWAHNGGRTFERISSGKPHFVMTLASPGTTATWCAKSGLDTTVDNVSCDSAATDRVMINAYRWAQGSRTYGGHIHAYRQMLINHEVGHRLGYDHVTCDNNGDLAPVMQQQTKFLEHDGIRCKANPWPYPGD